MTTAALVAQRRGSAAVIAALAVSVVDGDDAAVAGGTVQQLRSDVLIDSQTPDGSGECTFSDVQVGDVMMYQPPLAYCLGPSEPDSHTIIADQTTLEIVAQPAFYSDDFQSYANIGAITYGSTGIHSPPESGKFGYASPQVNGYVRVVSSADQSGYPPYGVDSGTGGTGVGQFSYPTTEGPSNTKALKYTWTASPTNTPGGSRTPPAADDISNYYVKLEFRTAADAWPVGTDEVWLRFTDKLDSGWRCGGGGATGSQLEYKYFFINVQTSESSPLYAPIQIEIDDQNSSPSSDLVLRQKMIDVVDGNFVQHPGGSHDEDLAAEFLGEWHTWVVGITGIGTATCVSRIYLDGELFSELPPLPWLATSTIGGPDTLMIFEMGANINNGPDQEQYRWWRELGVYQARPSLLPLVP